MGMRSYLTMLYQHNYVERDKLTVAALIDAYSQFVGRALFEPPPGSPVRQVTDTSPRRGITNGAARIRK
jgi:hypothetical protein